MSLISTWAETLVGYTFGFLNSNFSTAVIAGALGAYAGARGAQIIISKEQSREQILREINTTNSCLSLVFSIANSFMSIKKQHIIPMKSKFKSDTENIKAALSADDTKFVRIEFDLRTLSNLSFPMDLLESYVFERLSLKGRGLSAAFQIVMAYNDINNAINFRNNIVTEFKNNPVYLNKIVLASSYLGIAAPDGSTDRRYLDNLDALMMYADDGIFFSKLLSDELLTFGRKLKDKYQKISSDSVSDISEPVWEGAMTQGLMPSEDSYRDWLKGFKEK